MGSDDKPDERERLRLLADRVAEENAPDPSRATARTQWGELPVIFAPLLPSSKGTGVSPHRDNLIRLLENLPQWRDVLAIDEFSKRIVCLRESPLGHAPGGEWSTDDDVELSMWFTQQPRFMFKGVHGGLSVGQYVTSSLDVISEAVRAVACKRKLHPVRQYLESVEWDRTPRVDTWPWIYLGARETEYHARAGRYFLLNMVRRIYEPGCVMRSVPVLEGVQNLGKSRALHALARPWFSDTMFRVGDKDAYLSVQGVWVYEISELDAFSKAEATAVKAFISSTEDNFRAPYERRNAVHKRQVVFAATTNAAEYLTDFSGNTRFHPIACGAIDLDVLERDRDQLLAEALYLYRKGEHAYPRGEEVAVFEAEVERRLAPHPWIEKLEKYTAEQVGSVGVSMTELLGGGLGIDLARVSPNGLEARKVGSIMQMLGWVKARPRTETGRSWRYYRPHEVPRVGRPESVDNSAEEPDLPAF
ncbi:MAG: virulence-associated E family protein [Burkholderiaceae bacterium]|jgi:predicted P-loop ATPase|nr:virulence-associated E family protein [Burkholderiaceae bacterium]